MSMLRCKYFIAQTKSEVRARIHHRLQSSGGQRKLGASHLLRPKSSSRDKIFSNQTGITSHATTNTDFENEDPTRPSNDLLAEPKPPSIETSSPSKATDVTVESLLERMDGDPLNIKARNPLAAALASIRREKEEIIQIFGAPLIDDMVPSLGKAPPDPNAYDAESYRQYRSIVDILLADQPFNARCPSHLQRPVIEWLHASRKTFDVRLPTFDQALKHGLDVCQNEEEFQQRRLSFQDELNQQRTSFLSQTGMNQEQLSAASRLLAHIGRVCAKRAWSLPLEVAWEKSKEAGLEYDVKVLMNYLHVVSSYPGRANAGLLGTAPVLSIFEENHKENTEGTSKDDKCEGHDIRAEIAFFHDLLYAPTENSLVVRVKSLVAHGKAAQAEALLEKSASSASESLRNRSFLPIFNAYLDLADITGAIKIFSKLKNSPNVTFDNHVGLIAAIAEAGIFRRSANPIDGAFELGYKPASGPRFFDQLVTEMTEQCFEINSACARRLYNALERCFRGTPMARNVEQLRPLSPIKSSNEKALPSELIVSRVTIDPRSGVCPRSGVKLRLLEFTQDQKEAYTERLFRIGQERHEEMMMKLQGAKNSREKPNPMLGLSNWLSLRKHKPFTVILDGGNVGYHMQNYDQGKFNYHQLQFMVDEVRKLNENPLIILPWRFTQDRFALNARVFGDGKFQKLNDSEKIIRDRLMKQEILFRAPYAWHDDLFLMVATLCDQKNARKGKDLTVEPNNQQGQWPGIRPVLITNDQMKENWPSDVDRRLFRRWYSSCVVNYKFVGFFDADCSDDHISFSPAEFFSREIQSNVVRGLRGEETVWHFPVSDWGNEDWFCVKLPN